MIIARAPLRISFAGGGSDLPAYFMKSEEPGMVVSAAIQKYVYVVLNKKFDDDVCVKYSKTENVRHASELEHDIIRETLKHFEISKSVEVATIADVPGSGTGLGSSSALTVALICALAKYTNTYYTPYDCAKLACEIEIDKCGHPIGYQDQFASAFGGLNTIEFRKRETRVDAIKPLCGTGNLENSLAMFWVGTRKETANEILREQNANLSDKQVTRITQQMAEIAKKMSVHLWADESDEFGKLLHEGWELKKTISPKITTTEIDEIYKKAIQSGAIGGKICGAGGGGFMLIFSPPTKKDVIIHSLSLKTLPIKIDMQGVRIIEQK